MVNAQPEPGGYDPRYFARLDEIDGRRFWCRSRNRAIGGVLSRLAGLPPGYAVVEIGCGSGNVLRHLETICSGGRLTGLTDCAHAARSCRRTRPNRPFAPTPIFYGSPGL